MYFWSTSSNVLLRLSNAIARSPRMSRHFTTEKHMPASLFIQLSITSLITPSKTFPISPSATNTAIIISTKATIFSVCSGALIYCASHWLAITANFTEAQTPTTMDAMEITCDIRPFLSPCMTAGIRQIKIMISSIFILPVKSVYLQIEIFGAVVPIAKIDNYF